jgi:hypothetical protein
MSVELDDFVHGLRMTFETMVDRGVEAGRVGPCAEPVFADISTHIPLVDEDASCVVMTLTRELAVQLVRDIAGVDSEDFPDDLVGDAVGELLNMVVGATQRHSSTRFSYGHRVASRVERHEVKLLTSGPSEGVQCRTGGHVVWLYLVRGVTERHLHEAVG